MERQFNACKTPLAACTYLSSIISELYDASMSMVWAVFQYGVEGWTLKKSDRNRIEAFEMWYWRKKNA